MYERVAVVLAEMQGDKPAGKEKEHHPVKKPSLAYMLHHSPKGVRQGRRQEDDR
jgi:hypothetical protein